MPSSASCITVSPLGVLHLERHDLALERPRLRRRGRAPVALERESVELLAREVVLLRHHLRADELAEPGNAEALLDPLRPRPHADALLGRQRRRRSPSAPASCSPRRPRSPRPACPTSPPARRSAAPAATSRTAGRSTPPARCSGSFDASTALRPMCRLCSPTCPTQPMITSSIAAGSIPVRSTSAFSTSPAMSAGCHPASRPPFRPPAVRTASTI